MTTEDEPKKTLWKSLVDLVNTWKVVAAVFAALSMFIAWNNKQVVKDTISVQQFNELKAAIPTKGAVDTMITEAFEDYDDKLNMRGQRFVKEYVQPMMANDEKLANDVTNIQRGLREVVTSQANVSKDIKEGMLKKLNQDSIAAENARLRSELHVQDKMEQILEELKKPEPAPDKKKRRDRVE